MPRRAATETTLAARIRARRDELGITQRELGRRSKFESTDIWKYENARAMPSLTSAMRLAEALCVSIDWLLTGRESRHAPRERAVSS